MFSFVHRQENERHHGGGEGDDEQHEQPLRGEEQYQRKRACGGEAGEELPYGVPVRRPFSYRRLPSAEIETEKHFNTLSNVLYSAYSPPPLLMKRAGH